MLRKESSDTDIIPWNNDNYKIGRSIINEMASVTEEQRGVVLCENCGAICPVEIGPEETIRLIGRANCFCGDQEFRLLE